MSHSSDVQVSSLEKALGAFVDLSERYPHVFHDALDEADISSFSWEKTIQEAIDLDPTEVTGVFFLRHLHEALLTSYCPSAREILREDPDYLACFSIIRELSSWFDSDDIHTLADAFQKEVKTIVDHHQLYEVGLDTVLNDFSMLALLRRDAFRTLNTLHSFVLCQGEPPVEVSQVSYGKSFYRWPNTTVLMKALPNMPDGIFMHAIMPPEDLNRVSFMFSVKRQGHLVLLSDKDRDANPFREANTRNPGRLMAERMNKHWFPYDKIGVQYDPDSKTFVELRSDKKDLSNFAPGTETQKPLSECSPTTLVWTLMVLELIAKKYWHAGTLNEPKKLSYAAGMIQDPGLLLLGETSQLPVQAYTPLMLPPMKVEQVRDSSRQHSAFGQSHPVKNVWLEDRYNHLIREDALFALDAPGKVLLLEGHSLNEATIVEQEESQSRWMNSVPALNIATLSPNLLGTREEIEADYLFVGRTNYARQVKHLAHHEYRQRKPEVLAWFEEKVRANLARLMPIFAQDEAWAPGESTLVKGVFCHSKARTERREGTKRMWLRHVDPNDYYSATPYLYQRKDRTRKCFLTGGPLSTVVVLSPENAVDLAFLCGVEVGELPDVLQHWDLADPYLGNSILDRVDPMADFDDPWTKEHFEVAMGLSKRGLAQLRKDYGKR